MVPNEQTTPPGSASRERHRKEVLVEPALSEAGTPQDASRAAHLHIDDAVSHDSQNWWPWPLRM